MCNGGRNHSTYHSDSTFNVHHHKCPDCDHSLNSYTYNNDTKSLSQIYDSSCSLKSPTLIPLSNLSFEPVDYFRCKKNLSLKFQYHRVSHSNPIVTIKALTHIPLANLS